MRKLLVMRIYLIIIFITVREISFAQADDSLYVYDYEKLEKKNVITKIHTDNAVYKGQLRGVEDSSIIISEGRKFYQLRQPFLSKDIQKIVFTAKATNESFIKHTLLCLAGGGIVAFSFLYDQYANSDLENKQQTGQVLLWGTAAGATLGFFIGALSFGAGITINIPIYKSPAIFKQEKSRLREFVIY